MLRSQRFLPSQLRAALEIVTQELDGGRLSNRGVLTLWFGDAREFLPSAPATTPLVNNITAAAVYRDQYGRLYAYADPSDWEYEVEPDSVPSIALTDQLFVAIPNALRHQSNENDRSVPLDAVRLPRIDEELQLYPTEGASEPMVVSVHAMFEPSDAQERVSSAYIQVNGWLQVKHPGIVSPQACLEALIHSAAA